MMLFREEDHDENPPASWTIQRVAVGAGRVAWRLCTKDGGVLEQYATRRDALFHKESGHLVDLYNKEGRWMRGESIPGWRPYDECK